MALKNIRHRSMQGYLFSIAAYSILLLFFIPKRSYAMEQVMRTNHPHLVQECLQGITEVAELKDGIIKQRDFEKVLKNIGGCFNENGFDLADAVFNTFATGGKTVDLSKGDGNLATSLCVVAVNAIFTDCFIDSHPTRSPVSSPTSTEKPVSSPTRRPTPMPTAKPVTSPTRRPTPLPTRLPTSSPTISPTKTKSPTDAPTITHSPTISSAPTTTIVETTSGGSDTITVFLILGALYLLCKRRWYIADPIDDEYDIDFDEEKPVLFY